MLTTAIQLYVVFPICSLLIVGLVALWLRRRLTASAAAAKMASVISLEHLLDKMVTQEAIIESLFASAACGQSNGGTVPELATLHEELVCLKQFVLELPPNTPEEIMRLWREKLVDLWNRWQAAKKDDTICHLGQKLLTVEYIIRNLFTTVPLPVSMLDDKLHQLEDLSAGIPLEFREMADIWREKQANFWNQLAAATFTPLPPHTMTMPTGEEGSDKENDWLPLTATRNSSPVKPAPTFNGKDFETLWKTAPFLAAATTGAALATRANPSENQRQLRASTLTNGEGNSHGQHSSSSDLSSPPTASSTSFGPSGQRNKKSKDAVREEMKNIFSQMKPAQGIADGTGMKNLLTTIATAGKLLLPFRGDNNHLKTDLFNCAIAKLSPGKRASFVERFGEERFPLSNLIRMLLADIVAFENDSNDSPRRVHGGHRPGSTVSCVVCLTKGHRIRNCPYLPLIICSKCFERGHFGKHCQFTRH